jgi:hypothetical protein
MADNCATLFPPIPIIFAHLKRKERPFFYIYIKRKLVKEGLYPF